MGSFVTFPCPPAETRAIRRRLTVADATRKTVKQTKKDNYFPTRKFAIKA